MYSSGLSPALPISRQLWWGVSAGRIECTVVMHPSAWRRAIGGRGCICCCCLCHRSFPPPEELSAPRSRVVCVFCHSARLIHLVVSLQCESHCISAVPQSPIEEGFRAGVRAGPKLRVLVCQWYNWTGTAVLRYSKFLTSYTCFTFPESLRWYEHINSKVLTKISCFFFLLGITKANSVNGVLSHCLFVLYVTYCAYQLLLGLWQQPDECNGAALKELWVIWAVESKCFLYEWLGRLYHKTNRKLGHEILGKTPLASLTLLLIVQAGIHPILLEQSYRSDTALIFLCVSVNIWRSTLWRWNAPSVSESSKTNENDWGHASGFQALFLNEKYRMKLPDILFFHVPCLGP